MGFLGGLQGLKEFQMLQALCLLFRSALLALLGFIQLLLKLRIFMLQLFDLVISKHSVDR